MMRRRVRNRSSHPARRLKSARIFEAFEPRRMLAGDLIAHWRADDLAATLEPGAVVTAWTDAVGGRVAAQRGGTPTLVEDQLGGRSVVRFDATDGIDSLVVVKESNPISGANDFSVMVAFVTSSTSLQGGTDEWFKGSGLVDSNKLGFATDWGLSLNSSGQVGGGISGGFFQPVVSVHSEATGLNDGQLHVATLSRSGGTLSLYVDDLPAVTKEGASTAPREVAQMSIGSLLLGDGGYTGDIAEVRFFDGALNASEIAQIKSELVAFYNNSLPVTSADSYTVMEDSSFLSVSREQGVLANDRDPEGDTLTATLIQTTEHGTLTFSPDGSFLYAPDDNFFGTDSFTYAAVDFRPSPPQTVTITVQNAYDPAVAVADAYNVRPTETLQVPALAGVLVNDVNLDQAALQAVLVNNVGAGSLDFRADGSFTYRPQGFAGVTSFTYRINDGRNLSNTVTVSLTVNTAPRAVDDRYDVTEDVAAVVSAANGVLANDVDAERDVLQATLLEGTQHGALTFNSDGSFQYLPNLNYVGVDTFTYAIADYADQGTTIGTVTLNVLPVNDPPVARQDLYLTFINQALTIGQEFGVLSNDSDVDSSNLSARLIGQAQHGTVTLQNDGSFRYAPTNGYVGNDAFTYEVSDGDKVSVGSVSLIVATLDQQVVINEVHYDPPDNTIPLEFIELYNQGQTPVDLSNWYFSDGVTYVFPAGTRIQPQQYLVIAQDPAALKQHLQADALGPYTGRLSSEGETIVLRRSDTTVIDEVDYRQGFPWPVAAGGDGPSMELINPTLDNGLGGSWRAGSEPTPGRVNSVFALNAAPQTRQVTHAPQQPKAGESTTITAKVTDPNGVASVELAYQLVLPGEYIPAVLPLPLATLRRTPDAPRDVNPDYLDPANWTRVVMVDDGTNGDAVAGDNLFTAVIPGQGHRSLVRYTITVEDTLGLSVQVPYEDDASQNFAYFVYDGVPEYNGHSVDLLQSLPVYHVIARNQDMSEMMAYSTRDQIAQGTLARFAYNWPSTFVYNGQVYDNINMRLRGANGRYHLTGKRSMRFRFNDGHYMQAHNQDGEEFSQEWRTLTTGKMFDNRQTLTYALNEVINMYLFNQIGVPATETFYAHFRVIDDAEEQDRWAGDFWGFNYILETYDVRFLDNHNLEHGNLYKLINQTRDWQQQQRYQAPYAVKNGEDHNNIENRLTGRSTPEYIDAHVNLEKYFLYHAFTEAIRHYDYWPDANKNMVYYFEPDYLPENSNLGKLWILPWDTDASWGPTWNNGHDVVYNSIFKAGSSSGGDNFENPVFWPEYFNVVREIRDLLWQPDQIEPLIEQYANVLRPMEQADRDRWTDSPNFRVDGGYRGLTGEGMKGLDALVRDMKNFAFVGGNWPGGNVGAGGQAAHLDRLQASLGQGAELPATPSITYVGSANFPADGLKFRTSNFVDPQGNHTFAAMEWRIAEVTNPAAPAYDPQAKLLLEWNASWESGELTTFANEIAPPTSAVSAGHAYRARVRVKDDGGHWSHWSDPISFIATPATSSELLDALRITEIHYHPADPTPQEVAAGFNDADDFEFLEIVNVSSRAIHLAGAQLLQAPVNGDPQGVEFDFSNSPIKQLAPGERVVVVEDIAAFTYRYGDNLPVAGQWTGALSNGGEHLTLVGDGFTIQQFAYDDNWYPETDGNGPSLELIDPNQVDLASWGIAASWRPSANRGGSPGKGSGRVVGDSNGDGIFNSSDMVFVFLVGKYEDGIPNNATFEEGDWNGDGDFDSRDFIFAFLAGTYTNAAEPGSLNALLPLDRADTPADIAVRDRLFATLDDGKAELDLSWNGDVKRGPWVL